MPLVQSPTLTARKLAANRANACKSTGPRTPEGKRRVMLNALKHGCRSRTLRQTLVRAQADVDLFDWVDDRVREAFPPATVRDHLAARYLTHQIWCTLWRSRRSKAPAESRPASSSSLWCTAWTPWKAGGRQSKPRYSLKSTDAGFTNLSQNPRSRIQIVDPRTQRRLRFWVRRRRGSVVRVPLRNFPEMAAWFLLRKQELEAGAATEAVSSGRWPDPMDWALATACELGTGDEWWTEELD
ncbi:MAG TPA: hypothetical protein VN648_35585 [Candidatus Methylomirabilis sp.]|nr:hypothetical protein [Candidatus Methylomirabilis sp.]